MLLHSGVPLSAHARDAGEGATLREHRYTLDLPHGPARIFALMQDYERWPDYAPMVIAVEVLHPGDKDGNGLLRRVIYPMPFGRRGAALELVTEVVANSGYTYTMLSKEPGNDQTGRLRLEPAGPNQSRLHFEERYNLTKAPYKWFEGRIYAFINKKNEQSMRALSQWLTDHPEYRPDLVET